MTSGPHSVASYASSGNATVAGTGVGGKTGARTTVGGTTAGDTTDGNTAGNSTCPLCTKSSVEAFWPFCSKTCAYVDLGTWLRGEYRLAGEPPLEEPLSVLDEEEE